MKLRDSRRLTGPNLLTDRPGAVLDVALGEGEREAAVGAWRRQARRVLEAVGWGGEELAARTFPGGASLALTAPIDALYAATEVAEWAWSAAAAALAGAPEPGLEAAAERLRAAIAAEANPRLRALAAAAGARGVAFLADDETVSVGMGAGSRAWPAREAPPPAEVPWDEVHDVPAAVVTGTNGKTTTVRLAAAMARAAGRTPGVASTDWVRVGEEVVDRGDWSGPGGARAVLRDRRVETAILETARGGLLRRGLAVPRAAVGAVTNVAEDHLGEFGVHDLATLVAVKLLVARGAPVLVANADDPALAAAAPGAGRPVTWFGLDPGAPVLGECRAAGGGAALLEGDRLVLWRGGRREEVAAVDRVPVALGGAARHNLANALAAIGVAVHLGLDLAAIREGLAGFESSPGENPGRLNEFRLGGARVVVDFAHNPHGLEALLGMAAALPARRRLVLLGQAGDRDDGAIRELVRIVWRARPDRPDRVIAKEMPQHLRGRAPGEVPGLIEDELYALGAPAEAVGRAESELAAVRQALAWARPGDLLLLLTHESRDEVLALLATLAERGWRPGEALPGE
jgi:UDP-N-acetylmuramyl tripeptide synthase